MFDLEKYALELPEDDETKAWKQKVCKKFEELKLPKNQQTADALELLGGYIAIARKNAFLQGFEMALKIVNEEKEGKENGDNKQNKKYFN